MTIEQFSTIITSAIGVLSIVGVVLGPIYHNIKVSISRNQTELSRTNDKVASLVEKVRDEHTDFMRYTAATDSRMEHLNIRFDRYDKDVEELKVSIDKLNENLKKEMRDILHEFVNKTNRLFEQLINKK